MIKPDRPSTLRRKYRESQPPDSRTALSPSSVSTGNTQNCGHFTRFLGEGRRVSLLLRLDGGEGEIRTPGTLTSTSDFESGAFNHSATSPLGRTGRFASLFSLTNGMECVISRTDAVVEVFRIKLGVSRERTSAPGPCSARPGLRWSPRPDGSAWDDSALAAWSGPHRLSDPRRHRLAGGFVRE